MEQNNRQNKEQNYEVEPTIDHIPVTHGELTLVTSESAESSMVHAAHLAERCKDLGLGTMLVNCAVSHKRLIAYYNEHHTLSAKKPYLCLRTSVRGNLISEADDIEDMIARGRMSILIILGWEWTSNSFSRRERLFGFLRDLMASQDVAVIVYSHTARKPRPGRVDRGGIGKLGLLAYSVTRLQSARTYQEVEPAPDPKIIHAGDEYLAPQESKQLSEEEIRELQGESQKYEVRSQNEIENAELRIEKEKEEIENEIAGILEEKEESGGDVAGHSERSDAQ